MFVSVHIEVVKKDVLYLLAVYFIKKNFDVSSELRKVLVFCLNYRTTVEARLHTLSQLSLASRLALIYYCNLVCLPWVVSKRRTP